jgi:hypothetical protein
MSLPIMHEHKTTDDRRKNRPRSLHLLAALLLLCASQAYADPQAPASPASGAEETLVPKAVAHQRFQDFCSDWMSKLRDRESLNQSQAKATRKKNGASLEYTGYSLKPLRCEIKPTGVKSNPFVGKLTYYERLYRKDGSTPSAAQKAKARILNELEVLEIFRFDGSDWQY